MIKIVKQLVPENKYYLKCPYEMVPKRIVVHNTENDASARNEISCMINSDEETSFHYAVDDKEIVQSIEENRNAWHISDRNRVENREGIGIEICYSKSSGDRFVKAENNAVDLIVNILYRYGWDIDKVTKQQDYNGKYYSHKILDSNWDRFRNNIKDKLSQIRERPFLIGDIIYNTEELYLHETAGYGGKEKLLERNTKSVVKKYHYNNGLYMALGQEKSYYDIAWTNDYSKFTKDIPVDDEIKDNNIEEDDTNIDKEIIDKQSTTNIDKEVTQEQSKRNSLLLLIDQIIKFIRKIFT